MKPKIQFFIINRMLLMFLSVIGVFLFLVGAVLWSFTIDLTAKGEGRVQCRNRVGIRPQVSGIIEEMKAREGHSVVPGELLFTLEDRERMLDAESCFLRIKALKTDISGLEERIQLTAHQIGRDIDAAKATLDQAVANRKIVEKGPKPEAVELARIAVYRNEIRYRKALSDYKQRDRAFSLKLISKHDLEAALHNRDIAEADLQLAQGELKLLLHTYDENQVAIAKAEVDRCRALYEKAVSEKGKLSVLDKELESAMTALAREEKRFNVLDRHTQLTRVTTPIGGLVLTHDPEGLIGKAVDEGETVLHIGDPSELIVECRISEIDFPMVAEGQQARIQIMPFPKGEYGLFRGHVTQVGADRTPSGWTGPDNPYGGMTKVTDRNGTYPVVLSLHNPYAVYAYGRRYEVKHGYAATVEIVTHQQRILTFLFRKVLRIKGRAVPDSIHL